MAVLLARVMLALEFRYSFNLLAVCAITKLNEGVEVSHKLYAWFIKSRMPVGFFLFAIGFIVFGLWFAAETRTVPYTYIPYISRAMHDHPPPVLQRTRVVRDKAFGIWWGSGETLVISLVLMMFSAWLIIPEWRRRNKETK